jgi:hypothetical protein
VLGGLPDKVKELYFFTTDKKRGMKEGRCVQISDRKAKFTSDATNFTSIISQ